MKKLLLIMVGIILTISLVALEVSIDEIEDLINPRTEYSYSIYKESDYSPLRVVQYIITKVEFKSHAAYKLTLYHLSEDWVFLNDFIVLAIDDEVFKVPLHDSGRQTERMTSYIICIEIAVILLGDTIIDALREAKVIRIQANSRKSIGIHTIDIQKVKDINRFITEY